ncbi:MAG: hypothetical protein INR72_14810 [Williamsia herbipolensis]|nr:hypothetical protein [Williamsia herbipolensis]
MIAVLLALLVGWVVGLSTSLGHSFSMDGDPGAYLAGMIVAATFAVLVPFAAIVHHHLTARRSPGRSLRVVVAAYTALPLGLLTMPGLIDAAGSVSAHHAVTSRPLTATETSISDTALRKRARAFYDGTVSASGVTDSAERNDPLRPYRAPRAESGECDLSNSTTGVAWGDPFEEVFWQTTDDRDPVLDRVERFWRDAGYSPTRTATSVTIDDDRGPVTWARFEYEDSADEPEAFADFSFGTICVEGVSSDG